MSAAISIELNQNGGVTQIIPFSVKLSDFVLVEPDPIDNPGFGEYKVTLLPNIGSKYLINKVVMKTSDDLIYQDGYKSIVAICNSNAVGSIIDGTLANVTIVYFLNTTLGVMVADGELCLRNGDTYGNAPITSLVDATLSGYIEITKEA